MAWKRGGAKDSEGQGSCSRSDQAGGQQAVWSGSPGTPAPLDTETGDALGSMLGSTPFLPQKKKRPLCPASGHKCWEGAAAADAPFILKPL